MTCYSTAPNKASSHPRRAGEWDFVNRSDDTSPVSPSSSDLAGSELTHSIRCHLPEANPNPHPPQRLFQPAQMKFGHPPRTFSRPLLPTAIHKAEASARYSPGRRSGRALSPLQTESFSSHVPNGVILVPLPETFPHPKDLTLTVRR